MCFASSPSTPQAVDVEAPDGAFDPITGAPKSPKITARRASVRAMYPILGQSIMFSGSDADASTGSGGTGSEAGEGPT